MSLNSGEYRLDNLAEDIGEQNDLKEKLPSRPKDLHKRLLQYLKDVDAEDVDAEDVDAEDVEDMRQARRKEVEGYRRRELEKRNPDPKRLRSFEWALRMLEANRKLDLDGNSI